MDRHRKGKKVGESANVAAFIAKLDTAIDEVMQTTVADGAKEALQRTAQSEVYSYSPLFYSRRGTAGGIADKRNMETEYGGFTLTIQDVASWQQIYGGSAPGERLAEALASGSARYHFHRAGPRPFHEKAEEEYGALFAADLIGGIRAKGF